MVYGIGYCSSESPYSNTTDKCYLTWRNMLKRCYSTEKKYEEYRRQGITVCEEWLDFNVFKQWFLRNYYEVEGESMHLDKDILCHGNKVYCPEYCVFVPRSINMLFVRNKNIRGDLPIGVMRHKKRYMMNCSVYGRNIKREFGSVEEAFECYKETKENYVKIVANKFKGRIPSILYNALMMYEVREDD